MRRCLQVPVTGRSERTIYTAYFKTKHMNEMSRRFDEQEAPLKNTDHAFVQVSRDGSPKIPDSLEKKEEKEITKNTEGSTEGQSPQNSSHGK